MHALGFAAFMLVLAGTFLLFPERIQHFAARSARMGVTGKRRFLLTFIESRAYLWSIRAVGAICLTAALLLFRATGSR